MLAEAMLLRGGELNRLGRIVDGATTSDFDADEKEARKSLYSSVLHVTWHGREINIIDTPGSADFIGQVYGALSVAELALISVNAAYGIEIGTRKAWDLARQQGCACMFVLTRMDAETAQFDEIVTALQTTFGAECTPLVLPVGSGSNFTGVVNLLHPSAVPEALQDIVEEQRATLMESVISGDDVLLERYLEGETISSEELERVFVRVLVNRTIVPILCCAAEQDKGVDTLLDVLSAYAPSPAYAKKQIVSEEKGVSPPSINLEGPLEAQVFKVMSDEFVGKVSFIRVYAGTLKGGDTVFVPNTGKSVKIPKLFRMQGKDQEETGEAGPGALVATAKVEDFHVGDTLYATKTQKRL
jgi:elongation factor G